MIGWQLASEGISSECPDDGIGADALLWRKIPDTVDLVAITVQNVLATAGLLVDRSPDAIGEQDIGNDRVIHFQGSILHGLGPHRFLLRSLTLKLSLLHRLPCPLLIDLGFVHRSFYLG